VTESDTGLVAAYELDGHGGGRTIGWQEIQAWQPGAGRLWVHLDYESETARQWLLQHSGLEETIAEALIASETRPRSLATHGGLLVVLRGANLNTGADADDMVAVRVWLEPGRIITTRRRHIQTIDAIRQSIAAGQGPTGPGDFLVQLADGLTTRVGEALVDLDDEVDALEDEVLSAESYELRTKIGDRALRFVEDLDSARDRAAVAQDELSSRLSEQMNKTMYVLSIVAGIFLPLGLLTGLLGINVGGMPGVDSHWAFIIVCVILVVVAVGQVIFFRRKGWM
jgi:zinc transporter